MNKRLLYWTFQIGGWSVYAAINIFFLIWAGNLNPSQLVNHLLVALFFIVTTHIYRHFIIRWGWLKTPMSRVLPKALTVILILSIINFLYQITILSSLGMFEIQGDLKLPFVLINLFTIIILYFSWSMIYFMFHYVENYNANLRYEASINEMELNLLKSQLNPHFIFNALNSIRALVDENPGKSKNAITQLSNILRNSLQIDKNRLTSFTDEMKTVQDYLELESIRFEERLEVDIKLHPNSDQFQIPPLMIQTLVENSIKHGISNLKEGGIVQIKTEVDGLYMTITIKNSGQYVNGQDYKQSGYGIENTKQRLRLIYGDQASFDIRNENNQLVCTQLRIPQIV
ncbi:MAG: histidine kinase [Bacteroidetes bacterium]|nr:histidine kinase [Bacteroidota bacterium]